MAFARETITGKTQEPEREIYLGVDGGGTKTLAVLIDGHKRVVSQGISGASNPVRVGIETAVNNIADAVSNACDGIGFSIYKISAGLFGLAGVRREDLRQRTREGISRKLKIKRFEVVTDAEIALYGAVKDRSGLVVIAGTGSICLGKNDAGKIGSAGGWGPLAGDEGGASRIAREGLRAIAKGSDGRGPKTKLGEKALSYFRAGKLDDLIIAIYAPQVDNLKLAGFAKLIFEAARDGDKVAQKIMNNAGKELGLAANAVIKKLKMQNQRFPVAKVGGVFNAKPFVEANLIETVNKIAPKAYLIEPKLNPAVGAAHMALKLGTEK